jgi:hypothetical protein
MAGIYKAYDIRGVVGKDLTPEIAYRIGDAFARLLQAKRLVVGRDMRARMLWMWAWPAHPWPTTRSRASRAMGAWW